MANLDSRSKRASSVGFWKPYVMALPLPDGAISQGDRQHSVWDYSGILATSAVIPAFPGNTGAMIPDRETQAIIPFRDKRAYAKFRDKRAIGD